MTTDRLPNSMETGYCSRCWSTEHKINIWQGV